MTCTHVLGLIDAGPFADYPRAHIDAAWEHARQCATCGPALEAATALTADLAALPQPAAPPAMTSAVLARIAEIEKARAAPVAAAMPQTAVPFSPRDWSAWATALGSLAAGFAIVLSMTAGEGVPSGIASRRVGGMMAALVPLPLTAPGAFVFVTGLVIYVIGLFAPLEGKRGP